MMYLLLAAYVAFCYFQLEPLFIDPYVRQELCYKARRSFPFLASFTDAQLRYLFITVGFIPGVNFFLFRELDTYYNL